MRSSTLPTQVHMLDQQIIYCIDVDGSVVSVAGQWDSFALQNDGADAASHKILGTSYLQAISNLETQAFYEQVFFDVRMNRDSVTIPFRCDSPYMKRAIDLIIQPAPQAQLLLTSQTTSTKYHSLPLWLYKRNVNSTPESVVVCSVCKSIQLSQSEWCSPDNLPMVAPHHCVGSDRSIVNTICPQCINNFPACRFQLHQIGTAPEKHHAQPLIVLLRQWEDRSDFAIGVNNFIGTPSCLALDPFRWELESDPVEFIVSQIETAMELRKVDQSSVYIVAYENASDLMFQVAREFDEFAAGVLLNPQINGSLSSPEELPLLSVSSPGAYCSPVPHARKAVVPFETLQCLGSLLISPHVGDWLFDRIRL